MVIYEILHGHILLLQCKKGVDFGKSLFVLEGI